MTRTIKIWLALASAGVLLGALAPASYASGASLKLKAPRKISASAYFRIKASGVGTHAKNYLGVFFTLRASCPSTYAGATSASHTIILQTFFVHRTFSVKLHRIHGGSAATGRLCAYLYPQSTSPTWSSKKPEASVSRKIRFT